MDVTAVRASSEFPIGRATATKIIIELRTCPDLAVNLVWLIFMRDDTGAGGRIMLAVTTSHFKCSIA